MIIDSLKNLVVTPQHPLLVAGGAEAGIVASQATISDGTLSTILQIIVAISALLKMWMDYQKQNKDTNKPNNS